MNDKQQFYDEFFAEMQKAVEPTEIQISGENLEAVKGIPGINFYINDTLVIPPIYPEQYIDMCKNGIPMEDIVRVEKKIMLEKVAEMSVMDIHNADPEEMTGKIRAAVVNYDSNKDWIKNIPHEKLLDLAVYAKIDYGSDYGIKVDNHMLTDLHMTKEEVFKAAKQNTAAGRELISVKELALDYICEHGIGENETQVVTELISLPSYIFDNRNGTETDGAAVLSSPSTLKQIHKQFGEDFYILPCCTDQLLYLPKSKCSMGIEGLEPFVKQLNEKEIPIQEQLSDKIYEFDGTALKIAGSALTLKKELTNTVSHHRSR
jgi:hypothetical protein